MRGHLRALSTIIPLSTEKESTGRPAMFQARILTGLPSVAFKEKDSEHGIFFTLHCSTQLDMQSCARREREATICHMEVFFYKGDSEAERLGRPTCNLEISDSRSRCDHQLELFLGNPEFNSSAALVNGHKVCLLSAGIANHVMLYL